MMPRVSTSAGPDFGPVLASLRSLRRSGLVAIAMFALGIGWIALRAEGEPDANVDRRITYVALALAGVSILTRRTLPGAASPRAFVATQIASVLCSVGLGLLGAVLAVRHGQWQVGLLYNVAAALLLFRVPGFGVAPPRGR
jgi:TRAP-type C4-dicarboxylate transport system permease small subunit